MRFSSPSASTLSSHRSRPLLRRCSCFTLACMCSSSVEADPGLLDHAFPFRRLALHVFGKLGGPAGPPLEVVRREEFLAGVGIGEPAPPVGIHLIYVLARRTHPGKHPQ